MKLSSFINCQQSDKRLCRSIRGKFGDDTTIVIGNWSAGNIKYHEPIRGVRIRKMFKKEGFKVYLLDEYKTLSVCPSWKGQLEKFKEVNNPRLFRRNTRPKVTCHGLLRCTNQQCLKDADTPRLWNRDLVDTLNFREILFELRKNGTRLICFRRPSTNYASKQKESFSDECSKNKRHKTNPL